MKWHLGVISLLVLIPISLHAVDRITMHGRLVSKADHAPLSGVTVSIVGGQGNSATTDSDGRFSVLMDARTTLGSEVTIQAAKPGFVTYSGVINVAAILDKDIELSPAKPKITGGVHTIVPPAPPPSPVVDYRPGDYLSVMFHEKIKLILMVGELDRTGADVLVRFTDEKGINRDSGNEKAILHIAGTGFDANLKLGISRLGGDLGGGGAFMARTMSTIPGQTVCTTYGPTYKLDPTLDVARLARAYDTCFSLGTMVSVFSIAFPGYGGAVGEFPVEIAAPIVVDRLLAGLDHAGSLKQLTITIPQDAFPTYSQVVSTRLNLRLKTP